MSGNTGTQDIPDGPFISTASTTNAVPMIDDTSLVLTSHSAYQGDVQTLAAASSYSDTHGNKSYVSGVQKAGAFVYASKAVTSSGSAVFYITDDGTASGNAVFTNIFADSINIVIYGNAATYQPFTPTVSGDKKSITISVNQVTNISVLSLLFVAASNGIDVRLWVMGN